MKHHDPAAIKHHILDGLRAIARADPNTLPDMAGKIFAEVTTFLAYHPVNQLYSLGEVIDKHLMPLKRAMPDLERRDDIVMGGHCANFDWVSATG